MLAILALLVVPGVVQAQPAARGRVEVSGGVRWMGPVDFGTVDANETTFGGGKRPLFSSDSQLDGSVGATAAVSVRIAGPLKAEAGFAYNPTGLTTAISGDVENASDTTARAPVTQFLIEGGLIGELASHGRLTPFVTGGAGYLRQLNDGRTLVETGRAYYAGIGLYYVRAAAHPGRIKASGLRVDARAVFLRDGVAPDSSLRGAPAVTAAFFARF